MRDLTREDFFNFTIAVNNLNIQYILPLLDSYKCKDELEGFLIHEHVAISRQLRVISILLENANKLQLDISDCCLILASQVRSIIENIAVVNFLLHDEKFTREQKLQEVVNFRNQAKEWFKNKKIESSKQLSIFMRDNYKSVNKTIWGKLSPDHNTLSKLIKSIQKTDKQLIEGETIFQCWDSLSKILHNNQLFRSLYWRQENNTITLNYEAFDCDLTISMMVMSNLFLYVSLDDLVVKLNDVNITRVYKENYKIIESDFLEMLKQVRHSST